MDCATIQTIIPDYISNVASDSDMRRVEEHLCVCHDCRLFLGKRIEDPTLSTQKHVEKIIAQKSKLSFLDYSVMGIGIILAILFVFVFFKR